jgi:hypothetical protein
MIDTAIAQAMQKPPRSPLIISKSEQTRSAPSHAILRLAVKHPVF